MATKHVKRVTLTSKKNWWMVEFDSDDEPPHPSSSIGARDAYSTASDETMVQRSIPNGLNVNGIVGPFSGLDSPASIGSPHPHHERPTLAQRFSRKPSRLPDLRRTPSPSPSPSLGGPAIFNIPRHPSSIFSFPTPTAYSAPPNPTWNLEPVAHGSASELFKCIVKKPDVVQLEINGEMQSNASDVTTQFLAELRVYTHVTRHRNIAAFLGSLENVGMVLEYIDGRSLYDVIKQRPELSAPQKVDFHNQLLDGLTHLHSFRLSHGDLSLLNIQVTHRNDTIKLLDFGRSVSADSTYSAPDDEPTDPFAHQRLIRTASGRTERFTLPTLPSSPESRPTEQIHPGTRPFAAPEVLRGECKDALLADAYSFGMILVCLDRCEHVDVKPWDQRKDKLPEGFMDGCEVLGERAGWYLKRWDERRRLVDEDRIVHGGKGL